MIRQRLLITLDGIITFCLLILIFIWITGGKTFDLGLISLSVHGLKNPLLLLCIVLIARRVLAGTFFHHFALLRLLQPLTSPLARRFAVSDNARASYGVFSAILLMLLLLSRFMTPLHPGMLGTYYPTESWSGDPFLTVQENTFNVRRMKSVYPEVSEHYSIEWTGHILIPEAGEYQFFTISDDGSELWIGETLVVDNRGLHGVQERSGKILLKKQSYPIRLRYMQGTVGAELHAYWQPPGRDKSSLSRASIFAVPPSESSLFLGRLCSVVFTVSSVIFLILCFVSGMVLLTHYQLLAPVLKTSFPGKQLLAVKSALIKRNVPQQVLPKPASRGFTPLILAFMGYTVLSLVWTYPLILKFSTSMFGLGGDRYIYLWDMWWMKKSLLELHTNPLYTDYLFYPKGIDLSFHDFSIFNSLLSVPLQSVFSVEEIYNLLFLSSFVLGGFGSFLLVRYLTGSSLAGFLSGLIFAFWGGRAYYVDHLSLASIQWFPYGALYLLKTLRERSCRNPLLAAVFLAINALSAWYYAIYMALFTALFLLYFALTERAAVFNRQFLQRIALAGFLFFVIMLPLLFPMFNQILRGEHYMVSELYATESVSANVLFFPNINHGLLGKYVRDFYLKHGWPLQWGLAGGLFIGYTALFLGCYTLFRLRHLKPGFWFTAFLVFLVLAFGPHPLLLSKVYDSIPLPYLLLRHLPILKIIRIPERFMILVMFSVSVLAGYACWDIFRRYRFKTILFVLLATAILFESFRFYYERPTERVPQFYQTLRQDSEPYAILELTTLFNWQHSSVRASLFQLTHEKKLFHGHASRVSGSTYYQAYALYTLFDDLFTLPKSYHNTNIQTNTEKRFFETTRDKQALLEILHFYNVRYITLYPDYWHGDFQHNFAALQHIFGEPAAREPEYAFFAVTPAALSCIRIFPAFGLFPLSVPQEGTPVRQTANDAEFYILSPPKTTATLHLQFEAHRFKLPEEQVEISFNGMLLTTESVGDWTTVDISDILLKPGENILHFHTCDNDDRKYGIQLRHLQMTVTEQETTGRTEHRE